ncbi:BTB domain-containing protein [Favolaschia claudopus]|uniref:BTB domain-containing protein n=1 Tax=Favolaschia claudopus TaxID=2862362 RepID=A0AAW0BGB3_9AGAR
MASQPAKRQRTEDEPITRSDTWFPDGNVVLQAGNTQFRVHWGVLALHSSVFSDMQGLPQPPEQPSVEGCPVVELQDDEEDVKFLLKALYTPAIQLIRDPQWRRFLTYKVPISKLPFSAVAALVRLGRKYEFQDLHDSAVGRLTARFPTTLEGYDALKAFPDRWSTIDWYSGLIFDAISLATENNLFAVLPCAYTEAVINHNTATLFDGIENKTPQLSGVYLRKCVLFQQSLFLKQFNPSYTLGWLQKWEFEGNCTDAIACRTRRERMLYKFMNSIPRGLFKPEDIPVNLGHLCSTCRPRVGDLMRSGRQKLWDELPKLLDLPPWAELKNGD